MAAYQLYPTGVTVREDDELLSLSTCEYSSTNGRLIVLVYAAECDEYHSLGKLYKSTNLDEILAKYREIIDDPTLSYYGNGMGITYRDPNDTFYDEAEVSLVSRKSIRGDNLDDVAFLEALPMVHEALEKIIEAFPDFRYYPPKELDVHYYPEKQ